MKLNVNKFAQAAGCLSPPVQAALLRQAAFFNGIAQDIRLRAERPVAVACGGKTYFLTRAGNPTDLPCGDLLTAHREDVDATFQRICNYSVYARQKEIVNGFITLSGGHRAGICGTAVLNDNGITNIRAVSSINLRIAGERKGCAKGLYESIGSRGSVLICGEPCSGKTTVLRDLARTLSIDGGQNVSLIDERGELAAVCDGVPQNDVGLCDVFDGYPKGEAIRQALRTMSPQVVICDEIGGKSDVAAVRDCLHRGVRLIATAHARNETELFGSAHLKEILQTGAFAAFVFLSGRNRAGEVSAVVRAGERRAA